MDHKLKKYQGIDTIIPNQLLIMSAEAVAGINASNAVKIYGPDLEKLNQLSNEVIKQIEHVSGIKDVGILRNIGQPRSQCVI